MKIITASLTALVFSTSFPAFSQQTDPMLVTKIAFGSCNNQNSEQPMWYTIMKDQPQLFIFLGDNIYGDTQDMDVLRGKYQLLGSKPGYQELKKQCKVLAVWDDHDYGVNDGGKEYPMKKESKEIFLQFFEEPVNSERRNHEGIYTSYLFGPDGRKVQVILPDLRTFRDRLCLGRISTDCKGEYRKCRDTTKTMLGEAQWAWLEQQLSVPADLRIIGSSTQFLVDFNGWEAWVNMPHERQRMLRLIKKAKAEHLLFISGDLHYAELSRLTDPGYPIYDLTSSGLTHGHSCAGGNKNRLYDPYMDPNYGLITIAWNGASTTVTLEIKNLQGEVKIAHTVTLKELEFS